MLAGTAASVSPRHQIPRTIVGARLDAATVNALDMATMKSSRGKHYGVSIVR
jgi:hypothetical protein